MTGGSSDLVDRYTGPLPPSLVPMYSKILAWRTESKSALSLGGGSVVLLSYLAINLPHVIFSAIFYEDYKMLDNLWMRKAFIHLNIVIQRILPVSLVLHLTNFFNFSGIFELFKHADPIGSKSGSGSVSFSKINQY